MLWHANFRTYAYRNVIVTLMTGIIYLILIVQFRFRVFEFVQFHFRVFELGVGWKILVNFIGFEIYGA